MMRKVASWWWRWWCPIVSTTYNLRSTLSESQSWQFAPLRRPQSTGQLPSGRPVAASVAQLLLPLFMWKTTTTKRRRRRRRSNSTKPEWEVVNKSRNIRSMADSERFFPSNCFFFLLFLFSSFLFFIITVYLYIIYDFFFVSFHSLYKLLGIGLKRNNHPVPRNCGRTNKRRDF